MNRSTATAALAAATVVGLAACSSPSAKNAASSSTSSGAGSSSSSSSAAAQSETLDASAKGPAADVAGAKKGGTITVYAETTPTTLDPTNTYYVDSAEIDKLAFRQLTQYDIRGGKPVLVPDLATNLGEVSADKLTWTFHLKPGIKYMDGTLVKAQDIGYAIKRSFAHDVFTQGPTYQLTYFKGGDKYKGPYKSGLNFPGVSTPDNSTVVIHLAKPFPDMPYYASFAVFTPIPQAKDTKSEYQKHPMTTGPYEFQSYNVSSELKLVKNPNWDPKTDPVRHQYADAWDFKWGGDLVKLQQQVLASSGPDATSIEYDNIDSSLLPQVTGSGTKKDQLLVGQTPCTYLDQMDTRKIPLAVRKAIAVAYPYNQLYKLAGNSPITSPPASTIMPPAVPGYQKYALPHLTGTGNGDPAAAKAMLAKAGKTGFKLSWYYSSDSTISSQVSAARTKALQQAGFTVKAIGVPKAQIRNYAVGYEKVNMLQSPAGWCSDWPSGSSWFPVLFQTHSISDQNSVGELQDKALDAKINAIYAMPPTQQPAQWGAIDKYIMSKYLPALPTSYTNLAAVHGTKLGNPTTDITEGMPMFTSMFVKS